MLARILLALSLAVLSTAASSAEPRDAHAFSFRSISGEPLPLSRFEGRVLLVVNTASRCAFTDQYEGLQALWERYRDRGFTVLGVPSNDFGNQEPGKEAEIKRFCELNYGIDFPMTAKVHVVGTDVHPFYRWVTEALGPEGAPGWNFHKYLVGPDGRLLAQFPSRVEPTASALRDAIETALDGGDPGSG